jgi:hypothetical protein
MPRKAAGLLGDTKQQDHRAISGLQEAPEGADG